MHIQLFGPSIDGLKPLIIAGDAFPTPIINVFPPFSGFGIPFFFYTKLYCCERVSPFNSSFIGSKSFGF
jgi:hypothetical protein